MPQVKEMVGNVDILAGNLSANGTVEPLPEDLDPTALIKDLVPSVVGDNDNVSDKATMVLGKMRER